MDIQNDICVACESSLIEDLNFTISNDYILLACRQCGLKFIKSITGDKLTDDKYWDDVNKKIYSMPSVINEMVRKQNIYLREISKKSPPNKRLLDVGSGNGIFLNIAKEFGFEPLGIEPSEEAIKMCQEKYSVSAKCGLLKTNDSLPHDFGVISSWDVIEHVTDPIQFLRACYIHLAERGIFLLETPDESCMIRKLINILSKTRINRIDFRKSVYYSSHRFYFTRKALTKLLHKIGFHDIKIYGGRTMYVKELAKLRFYQDYSAKKLLKYKLFFTFLKYFPFCSNKQIIICRKNR